MSEQEKQALLDQRSMWKSLLEHEGFKRLRAVAEGQIEARLKERQYMDVATQEQVAHYNRSQGEEMGIKLFMRLAEIELELVEQDLEKDHG